MISRLDDGGANREGVKNLFAESVPLCGFVLVTNSTPLFTDGISKIFTDSVRKKGGTKRVLAHFLASREIFAQRFNRTSRQHNCDLTGSKRDKI